MVEAVQKAVAEFIQLNQDLEINWDPRHPLSFPGLVGMIEGSLQPRLLENRVQEMEDLFRKTFFSSEQITIVQQFWSSAGRVALEVLRYRDGNEETEIVICGLLDDVNRDLDRHASSAPKSFYPGSLVPGEKKETAHYKAVNWSPLAAGPAVEELMNLSTYFITHTEKQIRVVIEDLFKNTMAPWIQQGHFYQDQDLSEIYRDGWISGESGVSADEFGQRMAVISREGLQRGLPEAVLNGEKLDFRFLNGHTLTTHNPIPYLFGALKLPSVQALMGLSFGGMNPQSIVVDRMSRTWLTDFAGLDKAPVWLDFAVLESETRSAFVDPRDIQNLYDFEKPLLAARRLGEAISFEDVDADDRKLGGCIQAIRNQAAVAAGDDLAPYEITLLFVLGRDLIANSQNQKRKGSVTETLLYKLLLCGLICEKLDCENGSPGQARAVLPFSQRLSIDEATREVWVGGRLVNLTLREYDLLLYLYRCQGQLCKRSEIVRQVFGISQASQSDEESLLNTNISRLRHKIEQDPENPVFLLTVRGIGFKLILQPE